MQDITQGFENVDLTNDVEFFFHFLSIVDQIESFKLCKQLMLELVKIEKGHHILDVGCGLGYDLQRLSPIVGGHGRVVGIDYSDAMVQEAAKRAKQLNLPIEYYQGDAHSINFPNNSFDLCRSERVLMFLKNPQAAVAEMVRVLRPGGYLTIFDFYHDGVVLDLPDQKMTRKIVHALSDSFINGTIGAKLPALFRNCGLDDIKIVPHSCLLSYNFFKLVSSGALNKATAMGTISKSELDWWKTELEKAHQSGNFLVSYPGFIVSGRKIN